MAKKFTNDTFKAQDNTVRVLGSAGYTAAIEGVADGVIQPGSTLTLPATAYIHTVNPPYSTSAVHIQTITISGNNSFLGYSHTIPTGTIYWNGTNYTNMLTGNILITNTISHPTTAFGAYLMSISAFNSISGSAGDDPVDGTWSTSVYTVTGFGASYNVGFTGFGDNVIQPNTTLTQAASVYILSINPSYSISAVEVTGLTVSGNNPYLSYSHDIPTGSIKWNGVNYTNPLSGNVYITNTQTHPTTAFGAYFMTSTSTNTLSTGRWLTATPSSISSSTYTVSAFGGTLYPGAINGETKQRTMSRLLEEGII